jgi:hypothetical protein
VVLAALQRLLLHAPSLLVCLTVLQAVAAVTVGLVVLAAAVLQQLLREGHVAQCRGLLMDLAVRHAAGMLMYIFMYTPP